MNIPVMLSCNHNITVRRAILGKLERCPACGVDRTVVRRCW
jgi:predicted RNA-binding Zn-ribbon protein involved in translation (DUF1610 family)